MAEPPGGGVVAVEAVEVAPPAARDGAQAEDARPQPGVVTVAEEAHGRVEVVDVGGEVAQAAAGRGEHQGLSPQRGRHGVRHGGLEAGAHPALPGGRLPGPGPPRAQPHDRR